LNEKRVPLKLKYIKEVEISKIKKLVRASFCFHFLCKEKNRTEQSIEELKNSLYQSSYGGSKKSEEG
jgi:hypothetical protein